jgi:hypothetical protein
VDRDVLVPAGQAALVAGSVTIGTLTTAIPFTVWRSWPWWAPPAAALTAGGVAFTVASLALVRDHRRLLWALHRLEDRLDVDLDRDGEIGTPGEEIERRLIYVRDPGRQRRQEQTRDFRYWLKGAYNGRGTTWRAWRGQDLPSGREVTRPTWERYTERLLRAGLARRPYDTAPLELESDLRDALEAFRELW